MRVSNGHGDDTSKEIEVAFALVVEQPLAMALVNQHRFLVESDQSWKQVAFPELQTLLVAWTLQGQWKFATSTV